MRGFFVRVREWPGSGAGAAALGAGAFTGDNMKISSKFSCYLCANRTNIGG